MFILGGTMSYGLAEYIWLDGNDPVQKLRSKTRVTDKMDSILISKFPDWGFDGSSTKQAEGNNSDCFLKPVYVVQDPIRKGDNYLVLCEVFEADGTTPHPSNQRAKLRELYKEKGVDDLGVLIGFEQEYTFITPKGEPLGFITGAHYKSPQGPYYCGVGADVIFGRDIVEAHTRLCLEANLSIYGTNAEVMPGQWEFQIGPRKLTDKADPLTMSDHLWIARFLLHRIAENWNVDATLACKPVKGDWNGAGMHTNFSTAEMREEGGLEKIKEAISKLEKAHDEHIAGYGEGLSERLTGLHETCDIKTFKAGDSDRGASIRIPMSTVMDKKGYFEDRRPGANANPYTVSYLLLKTILS